MAILHQASKRGGVAMSLKSYPATAATMVSMAIAAAWSACRHDFDHCRIEQSQANHNLPRFTAIDMHPRELTTCQQMVRVTGLVCEIVDSKYKARYAVRCIAIEQSSHSLIDNFAGNRGRARRQDGSIYARSPYESEQIQSPR